MFRKTDPETVAPYLKDASNFSEGQASEVIIPDNRDELVAYLKANEQPVTFYLFYTFYHIIYRVLQHFRR